ncbi:MAG: universal stress protein [Acetobacteraceae bacterium]
MPKVVLMPVTGTDADVPVFTTALTVGRMFDAHLLALHVEPDVQREIASLAAADMGLSSGLNNAMSRLEEDASRLKGAAEAAWRSFCTGNGVMMTNQPGQAGVTSEWVVETGNAADWVAEYGRTCDMIVTGRGAAGSILAGDLTESALMESGKPVLLAASGAPPTLDGTIAIAWKDTREAACAVRSALPFIRRAARVVVFTVTEDDADQGRAHERLAASLRWHNANVALHVIGPDGNAPVESLLDAVTGAGCTMLVMGGYGHTRLREAVFGGFTRTVLERAPLPVLMAH